MTRINQPPVQIKEKLTDKCIFSAKTDLQSNGQFGEQWLVLTEEDVSIWDANGEQCICIPVSEVKDARAVNAIGGGMLLVDTDDDPVVLLRYTASFTKVFSFAANLISSVAKGEERPTASDKDFPAFCNQCNTLIPEGSLSCPICKKNGKSMIRMLQYARPYKLHMVIAFFLLIITTVVEVIPPYLTKVMIDDVLRPQDTSNKLLWIVAGLAVATVMMALMQTLRGLMGVWIGSKLMGDLRRDIYNSLMGLSLSFFDKRQTSQFISRVNSDSESMREFMTDGVIWVTGESLKVIAVFAIMFSLDWKLTLLALIPLPLMVLISSMIWAMLGRRWYQQWRAIFRLNVLVGDSLQGIRVVKAFGKEPAEKLRYGEGNKEVVRTNIRIESLWQGMFPLFSMVAGVSILLIWYYGGWSVLDNNMELGVLMAMIMYISMLLGPLQWVSQVINWASRAISAAGRVFEIMDTQSEVPDTKNPVAIGRIAGRVKFKDVTYGYEKHHPVIKDINLEVKEGEMIGLVGHSGAGKSTFINLLCRFYDTDEGKITMDGIDLRNISQSELRSQIGVVLQETFLFDGTIAENISYSKQNAAPEEIMQAAKIANAHDFIVRLPNGYDTRVGERGHRLSGGEKQRVAIARAIIHDPRILILDEATASVDTETERQIQEAISRLVKGRTTFAIAHRLSTLRNADRLVVIDKGKIAELGTHDELLSKEGIYFKLVNAQKELLKIKGVEG